MRVNLRKSLFILPNLFTLSNLFCGFYATLISAHTRDADGFYRAALLIVFAMFFDMVDGRVARLTRTQSAIGMQLDSLSDVISFGVAPSVLVYRWSLTALGGAGLAIAFAFTACGAIRLARFNVLSTSTTGAPKKPSKYILGLPIPGAAGILVSLVVANHVVEGSLPGLSVGVALVVVGLSVLMVSTVRFRSFKELKLSWQTVLLVSIVLGVSALLTLRFHVSFALIWLLGSYILLGVLESLFRVSQPSKYQEYQEP